MRNVLTIVLCVLFATSCQKDQSQLVKEAVALRFAGELDKAKEKLLQASKMGPSAEVYKELGNYYLLNEDNIDEAEKNYLASLQVDPNYINSIHNMGMLYIKRYEHSQGEKGRGDTKLLAKAKTWLDKALEINPNFALSHQEYAKYYFYLGQFDNALQEGKKAVRLDARVARSYIILGQVYLKGKRDIHAAIQQFEQAYAFDRRNPDTLYFLYYGYSKDKQTDKAKFYYNEYISLLRSQGLTDEEVKEAENLLKKGLSNWYGL